MRYEELLEKKEQIQVEILSILFQEKGRIPFQKLAAQIDVSRPSLDTYLSELQDFGASLGKKFNLVRDQTDVILEMDEHLNFDLILVYLLKQSIKFNLLRLLLEERNPSILELSMKLLISESTLFRKIKECNQLLKEFHIKIKNIQLIGQEEQIRYFYFMLYSHLPQKERPQNQQITEKSRKFIQRLEESLRVHLSISSQEKLMCWKGISDARRKGEIGAVDAMLLQKSMYQNDHLYQLLDSFFYQEVYTKSDKEHCETILFYSFLVSFFILNKDDYYRFDILRSKKMPAILLNITIREKMLNYYHLNRLDIEEEKTIEYQLSQINNKYYFFSGVINHIKQAQLLTIQKSQLKPTLINLLTQLRKSASESIEKKQKSESALDELTFGYGNVLLLLEVLFAPNIIILYDLSSNPVYQIPLEQFLVNHLRGIENIALNQYRKEKSYDLLITSKRDDQRKKAYYLSEYASAYDLDIITKKIEQLKQEKVNLR